jgi:hypothetical protein
MTIRPILFSGPMIKALLAGRKTQTRRILRWKAEPGLNLAFTGLSPERLRTNGTPDGVWTLVSRGRGGCWEERARVNTYAPGDLLWVRETWSHTGTGVWKVGDIYHVVDGKLVYRADGDDGIGGWFPAIHMPRMASRLTLVVTETRVQRLQEISEADAIAEGTPRMSDETREDFAALWTSINGKRAGATWADNPWIVAITFTVHHGNVDQISKGKEAA